MVDMTSSCTGYAELSNMNTAVVGDGDGDGDADGDGDGDGFGEGVGVGVGVAFVQGAGTV